MKIPLSLPPTREMSFSRLSPGNDSSCTGFREPLILEKEDRDGRNGLRAHTHTHTHTRLTVEGVYNYARLDGDSSARECIRVGTVPLQREFPEDIVDLLQVVSVHPF